MKPRLLIALVACLLVGFGLQTMIAWALFILGSYTGGTGVINNPAFKAGDRTDTGFVVPADWTSRTLVQWWGIGRTRETVSECVWVGSTLGTVSGLGRQATYQGFSAGWPLRSFCGTDYITPGLERFTPRVLADVPAWIKRGGHKVPVSPLWLGLCVNSLLFAAPVFAAWRGRAWFVRRRWLRLGLCLGCGYPVRGLDRCPECGKPEEAKSAT